jgi:hypothetical protein
MTITITDIKDWLEGEMFTYEDFVKAKENGEQTIYDDGTDDVCCGRYKCAEQLLMFINRKEKETNGTSK